MRAFASLLTLETSTGSEKQIRASSPAIRGLWNQTNSLGPPSFPASPLLADSDPEQLVLLCPSVFPSSVSTETPFLGILIKNRFFWQTPEEWFLWQLLY